MTNIPSAHALTSAPLRHRLRVELDAPAPDVWSIVGNHERVPEYCRGIERVVVTTEPDARECHFRPREGAGPGVVLREILRWEEPNVGYCVSADGPNAFELTNDLSIVTVAATPRGTMFTWDQYYDHADLPSIRASYDEGIMDIGANLVARFGGRVVERYVDGPLHQLAESR
jgi:hypothetical protein